jgi:hypothetical protein
VVARRQDCLLRQQGARGLVYPGSAGDGWSSPALVRFDDPNRQHTLYGFTTDGRTFYFTVGANESDIWVAQLETR